MSHRVDIYFLNAIEYETQEELNTYSIQLIARAIRNFKGRIGIYGYIFIWWA